MNAPQRFTAYVCEDHGTRHGPVCAEPVEWHPRTGRRMRDCGKQCEAITTQSVDVASDLADATHALMKAAEPFISNLTPEGRRIAAAYDVYHPNHRWIVIRVGDVKPEALGPDERMVICRNCTVPRCGHTTDLTPCMLPRHHRDSVSRPGGEPSELVHKLIVVCGGRDYTDLDVIRDVLDAYMPRSDDEWPTVLHGDAPGADTVAASVAFGLGYDVEAYPADWQRHGKAAGPIRNRQMLDRKPDLVIAFPGGKGTADCVAEAKRRGIPVTEVAA